MPVRCRVWSLPDSRRAGSLVAAAVYAAASALYLGLPLLTGPGSSFIGTVHNTGDPDATLAIWSFGWWPHAILHGLNPIVSGAVWAPDRVNLMWVVAFPALAFLFSPLTLLVGPFAAYNVAAIVLPAFVGWTGFLLCRYLTGRFWPSLVGGFLFANSGFELGHTAASHLGLSAAGALVPLIALAMLRFIDGEIGTRRAVAYLAPLFALQLLLSTEVVFTTFLAIAVALALYLCFAPTRRQAIRRLAGVTFASYVLAGLLTAPFVYYLLTGLQTESVTPPANYVADLTTFFLPSPDALVGAGGTGSAIGRALPSLVWQPEAYLGLPALVIIWLFVRERRRQAAARFVVAALLIGLIATLGPSLTVAGHRILAFPWGSIDKLPLYDNVLPVRLAVYLDLVSAVVVALWAGGHRAGGHRAGGHRAGGHRAGGHRAGGHRARGHRARGHRARGHRAGGRSAAGRRAGALRVVLPLLAVIATLPDPFQPRTTVYDMPPFFSDPAYRQCLDPGATVLVLPIVGLGETLLWQARDGFRFNMAGGKTGNYVPPDFKTPPSVDYITSGNHLGPEQARDVESFIRLKHVTAVAVVANEANLFNGALDRLAKGTPAGGVVLYNFGPAPPSCPES